MKRILLVFSICLFSIVGFAQHTQNATGFTNTCDNVGVLGTDGFSFSNWPLDGGYDNTKVDTIRFGYYVAASSNMYMIFELNNTVNFTAPNNLLSFKIAVKGSGGADTSFTATVKLENATVTVSDDQTVSASQVYSAQSLTFAALGGQDLTAVKKVTITLANASGASKVGIVLLTLLKGGSSVVVASANSALSTIASSKVYPNPVSDMARVELELKSTSAVKVTLSDLMGKEVMTITEGSFSDLAKDFSVAGLNKGIYTVNYFINGAAAKSELLMVK